MSGADAAPPVPPALATVRVAVAGRQVTLLLDRPERANSLNAALVRDLIAALDWAEARLDCRLVVLRGHPGCFCTGMDFQEAAAAGDGERLRMEDYMTLLRRLSQSPKVVVARVEGRVVAGGVGLAAASDLVFATPRSEFSLSEALWGILPCCVLPFLIRRTGYQKAYAMTLTTRPVGAAEAAAMHLVDEVTEQPDEALRRLLLRVGLLEEETIVELKAYFRKLWILTPEIERTAVAEIGRLAAKPAVRAAIAGYATDGRFPWEGRG